MTPESRRQIETSIAQMEAHIAVLRALLDEDCDCPETTGITVSELWERHLASLPDEYWKASIVSTMKKLLARIGDKRVSALRPTDWQDYRDDPEIRAHYSVTTRNTQLKRAKTLFNWAVDGGRISVNPWQRVKPERRKPKRQTEVSHDGEAAVLERLDSTMQAFVLVGVDSAMRREEVRLLEWTDVDWERKTISIPAARTKTKRDRVVHITSRAAEAMQALPRRPGCPFVFSKATGEPLPKTHVWMFWRHAADAAQLRPAPGDTSVRYHDLRRTAARRLSRLGAPIAAIQRILGHESLATTAQYVDANSKDVEDAYALLEAAVRKGPHRAPVAAPTQPAAEAPIVSRAAS